MAPYQFLELMAAFSPTFQMLPDIALRMTPSEGIAGLAVRDLLPSSAAGD